MKQLLACLLLLLLAAPVWAAEKDDSCVDGVLEKVTVLE